MSSHLTPAMKEVLAALADLGRARRFKLPEVTQRRCELRGWSGPGKRPNHYNITTMDKLTLLVQAGYADELVKDGETTFQITEEGRKAFDEMPKKRRRRT